MKKVFKMVGLLVLGMAIGVVGFASYIYYDRPNNITKYSQQNMQQWLMDMIEEGQNAETRYFYGNTATAEMMDDDIGAYLDELAENSLRYGYDVSEVSYLVTQELSYISAAVSIDYTDKTLRYKNLEVMETPRQAQQYILDEYNKGNLSVFFLCDGDEWTEEVLANIGKTALMNTVNSTIAKDFNCLLQEGPMEQYKLAMVEIGYFIGSYTLFIHDEQLDEELGKMEASIRDLGLTTDKELYTAAGKAIAKAAEYDDELVDGDWGKETIWINRSAYGAVVSGKTVCTGYAKAYKALCDRLDLPCWVVVGASDGEGHAWNMIQLDGEIFYADCTFFDTSGWIFPLIFSADELEGYGYVAEENQICPWAIAA